MNKEWIAVELVSVLVENFACLYFLDSRYKSKYNLFWPQFGTWVILISYGFITNNLYGFIGYGIMLIYLIIFKYGTVLQKIFGILIVGSVEIGTSIVGAGLASVIESTTIEHTLQYQDTSRLLAILFIKMMQMVIFYIFSKKHAKMHNLQKRPVFVLSGVAVIDFVFLFLIWIYIGTPDLQIQQNALPIWLAIGALLIMVAIFVMYELFIYEELKNVELAMKLQRFELESSFLKKLDNIYSDMRIWKHEYKNNLSVLRALVKNIETEKALDFIDSMHSEIYKNQIVLQTGNLALDAIVSSKLWLAQSQNIEVSIQVVYPKNHQISDNDLCTIVGNLIDNAIEACTRMEETAEKKFINFSLIKKRKNLLLSISNSYNDELKISNGNYLTAKKEPFHGIGISYVDSIVEKYQGYVQRLQKNGVFETHIILPLLSLNETNDELL